MAEESAANRERIGKMFELMAPVLDDYLSEVLRHLVSAGEDWSALLKRRDTQRGIAGKKTYNTRDPNDQLRAISENIGRTAAGTSVFSALVRAYASELRVARNAWAHFDEFSRPDVARAFDTGSRLLKELDREKFAEALLGVETRRSDEVANVEQRQLVLLKHLASTRLTSLLHVDVTTQKLDEFEPFSFDLISRGRLELSPGKTWAMSLFTNDGDDRWQSENQRVGYNRYEIDSLYGKQRYGGLKQAENAYIIVVDPIADLGELYKPSGRMWAIVKRDGTCGYGHVSFVQNEAYLSMHSPGPKGAYDTPWSIYIEQWPDKSEHGRNLILNIDSDRTLFEVDHRHRRFICGEYTLYPSSRYDFRALHQAAGTP